LRFAPLNAAAAVFDGDDGNRVFTGSQQSTSGMFTRPFAPNKNQEFLPILLFLESSNRFFEVHFGSWTLHTCKFASTNTASRHHKMACKTAKRRHTLQNARHRRHIFAFSLKFIMRLA
jgi:hypothetical protein